MLNSEMTTASIIPTKQTSPDEKPPADLFDETFVVKLVNGEVVKATFSLHKGIAAFSSDYFKTALRRDAFKEGEENCIEVEDVNNIVAFKKLIRWMYTHKIDESDEDEDENSDLVDLWILSDRFLVPKLGNAVINRIHKMLTDTAIMSAYMLKRAYQYTPEDSDFRRFAIAMWVLGFDLDDLGDMCRKQVLGKTILCDIIDGINKFKDIITCNEDWQYRLEYLDLCEYHSHKEGERCE